MKHFEKMNVRWFMSLLLLACSLSLDAQQTAQVKGSVLSEQEKSLQGVTIQVLDAAGKNIQNTSTNEAGVFKISNLQSGKKYDFLFTYVGHEPYSLKGFLVNSGESNSIAVLMKPAVTVNEDVVVVGYGSQKKVNLTGAVDQVGSEYFDNRPMANVGRGLQGVIPNLNIKMTDGKPTRSPSYNVRGLTSIGSGGSALILIDGVPGDPATINPNDIQSVSVIKDASAAAIYGARGAYGVVLITTKSPKKDKIQVNYSGSYSVNQRTTTPDLVSDGYVWAENFVESFYSWNDYLSYPQSINSQLGFSLAYLDSLKAHSENPSLPQTTIDPLTGKYQYFANTDWFKELYKDNSPALEQSISVSGGSEKVNFMISGRYYHQDGIFRYNTDKFNRYNVRFKGSIKANDWLTINTNTDYSSYKYTYPLTSVGGLNAVWRMLAVTGFPVSPLFNPDGTMTIVGAYSVGDFYYGKSKSTTTQNFLRNTVGFNAVAIKNKLNIKGDFSYLFTNTEEQRKFFPVSYSTKPGELITSGLNYLNNDISKQHYFVGNLYGEYSQKFGEHDIKLLGGWNIEHNQVKDQFVQRDGLLVDDLPDFNLATGLNYSVRGGGSEWATSGIFYRANYAFKDRYLLELNGRYDGSSKFPTTQQFGFFPSVSAAWKISEENFMQGTSNWLSSLKLRGSYGSLGNGNINPYTFLRTIGAATSNRIVSGAFPSYIQQPAVVPDGLTWEKSTTLDIGLDAELLSRRLNFTFDWYERQTTDMIVPGQPLPAVFGAAVPRGNYADLETRGWELSISWRDRIKMSKPLTYSLRFTLGDNVSYITDYYNPNGLLSTYYKGQKVGDIWGYQTEGFFTSADDIAKHADQSYFVVSNSNKLLPGDLKFRDINGDGKVNQGKNTLADPGDQTIIGNSSIRLPYGFTGDVEWNNFYLSAFFQGVGQRDWYPSAEAAFFWGQNNRPYSFLPTFNLDRWTEENPSQDAYFPRYRGYTALQGTRELIVKQTRYLQNAGYIRLKNLTIGYSLPKSVIEKFKITSFRIYATGQNLWTYSPMYKITKNFDPEVIEGSDAEINANGGDGFSYPMQKSYTIGVNIAF